MDAIGLMKVALSDECGIDPDSVEGGIHLLDDLDIDSLDLLNAAFRIEKDCGVKLPVSDWLNLEYGDEPVDPSPFLVREICGFLERGVEQDGGRLSGS